MWRFSSRRSSAEYEHLAAHWRPQSQQSQQSQHPQHPQHPQRTLAWTLFHAHRCGLARTLALIMVDSFLEASRPFLLRAVVKSLEVGDPSWIPLIYAGAMLVVSLLIAVVHTHFMKEAKLDVGLRMQTGVSCLVYDKLLRTRAVLDTDAKPTSDEVNLISGDAMLITDSCFWVLRAPGFLFLVIFSVAMLVWEIGLAALPGLAVLVVALVAQWLVGKCQGKAQQRKTAEADKRLAMVREAVVGIRALKYGAAEEESGARIEASRAAEVAHLAAFRRYWAVNEFFAATVSVGSAAVAIVSYAYLRATPAVPVDAAVIFSAISLFNLLRQPLQFIPLLISAGLKGLVSVRRLERYLRDEAGLVDDVAPPAASEDVVHVDGASVSWTSKGRPAEDQSSIHLSGINLRVRHRRQRQRQRQEQQGQEQQAPVAVVAEGHFVAVVGAVASGKSTLLNALLGEVGCFE
eukprot:g5485.t1